MTPHIFEQHVRRLGRLKWPGTSGGSENVGGSQIDIVLRDGYTETTRLIEVTTEHSMAKVREDINKLTAARAHESITAFTVECWMVMSSEPTPDQRTLARSQHVRLLSLSEFEDPVFPKTEYAHLRARYSFGSVADPIGKVADNDIKRIETPILLRQSKVDITPAQLLARLTSGETVVLLGDFGAGKSLLTRDLYFAADKQHGENRTHLFPMSVNLRDHWGQRSADELFLRHLQRLGSDSGLAFFKAWQEGLVLLLLDGFDELAPQPWTRDKTSLQELRRKALSAVRDLIERKPSNVGMLIAGRSHYFPSHDELCDSLSLPSNCIVAELRELSAVEASAFLPALAKNEVAKWIPRRPLFLSYLAARGYADALTGLSDAYDVGRAWYQVLQMVCDREKKISESLDSETILRLLCRIAEMLRSKPNVLGPLSDSDLERVFVKETSHQPDQDAWAILQRLPGITYRSAGEKWLVDQEWADALAGLAFAKMLMEFVSFNEEGIGIEHPLRLLGSLVASAYLGDRKCRPQDVVNWIHGAQRKGVDATLICDAIQTAMQMTDDKLDFNGVRIVNGMIDTLDLDSTSPTGLTLSKCFIQQICAGGGPLNGFAIEDCYIEVIDGVQSRNQLPNWIDSTSEIAEFRFPLTNADVMRQTWPESIRLATVVLRKVYLQAGRGRESSALQRGIPASQQQLVPKIVNKLSELGLITIRRDKSNKEIIHGVRDQVGRIKELLKEKPNRRHEPWKSIEECVK